MKKANSMAELEQLILNEMQKAMTVVHSKSLKDTENEVQSFYSQGSPSIYKRTGKLGTAAKELESTERETGRSRQKASSGRD